MRKVMAVIVAVMMMLVLLAACGSGSEATASADPAPATDPIDEPDPDSGETPDVDDERGDMTSHNSYIDGEYDLLLSYPTVFSPEGEMDADGYMIFPSLQDDGKLLYWVTPNTYEETPADFMDRVAMDDMLELEGNVVIGKTVNDESLSVYFWVVDIDFIVNVEIHCDTSVSAEMMYDELQNSAVTIEAIGVPGWQEDDLRGDMTSHNSYSDGTYGYTLYYPTVFSAEGEMDANGYMIFSSLQDNTKLRYWVSPNTYNETTAEFIDHVGGLEIMELPGNVVIGKLDSMNPETNQDALSVNYWLVNADFIATVEIFCDTPEYADILYSDFQSGALYIESAMG
jgi:hypothetical protein